jgi:putative transcription factor
LRKKIVETCEMCSLEISNPVTIKVEGALLRVCYKCSSFGNVVQAPTSTQSGVSEKRPLRKSSGPALRRSKSPRSKQESGEIELITDYADEIRKGRMKKKLTQEKLSSLTGISVPFIKSIEAQKMRPTDTAAKKLERELGIELLVAQDTELEYTQKTEKKGTTLGDIAIIKRFDYD